MAEDRWDALRAYVARKAETRQLEHASAYRDVLNRMLSAEGPLPSMDAVRAYMGKAGWEGVASGAVGELWRKGDTGEIGVPYEAEPGHYEWEGVIVRLAAREGLSYAGTVTAIRDALEAPRG